MLGEKTEDGFVFRFKVALPGVEFFERKESPLLLKEDLSDIVFAILTPQEIAGAIGEGIAEFQRDHKDEEDDTRTTDRNQSAR